MLQWNLYVPGFVGALKLVLVPPSTLMLKLVPSSDVTVCVTPSLFFTVTVAPADTGPATVNARSFMEMSALDAALLELPLLLHAPSTRASARTTPTSSANRERGERVAVLMVMHKGTYGGGPAVQRDSRGSPSTLSPITLRWISL